MAEPQYGFLDEPQKGEVQYGFLDEPARPQTPSERDSSPIGIGEQPRYSGSPKQHTLDKFWGFATAPFQGLNFLANQATQPLVDYSRVLTQGEPIRQVVKYPTSQLEWGTNEPNRAFTAAMRTAPGFAGPIGSAALSGPADALAQKVENPDKPVNMTQTGIATAIGGAPAAISTGYRAARGGYRMLQRVFPSVLQKDQAAAQGVLADTIEGLRSPVNAGQALNAARATGDVIPLTNTAARVAAIDSHYLNTPADEGGKLVRAHIANLTGAGPGAGPPTQMSINDILKHLRDIGPSAGKDIGAAAGGNRNVGPMALYEAFLSDLEAAAASGSAGAAMAKAGLEAGKKNLAAARLADMVQKPPVSRTRMLDGASTPTLNVSELHNAIAKDRHLQRWLGPDGMQAMNEYIDAYKSLPPQSAFVGMNRLYAVLAGAIGLAGGTIHGGGVEGALVAATGVALQELVTDMRAVGANPQSIQQAARALTYLSVPAQAARSNYQDNAVAPRQRPMFARGGEVFATNDPLGIR